MGAAPFLVVTVLIMFIYWQLPYHLTDGFRRHRWHKFIPAGLSLGTVGVFFLKPCFISQGYSGIADIVLMILFGVVAVGLFLGALLWEPH